MANSSNLEGGYIEITADKIEINKGSSLQAKGDGDGGKVLVGEVGKTQILKYTKLKVQL